MIAALTEKKGVVTFACRIVGIPRKTHYEWYHTDPEYKEAVDDISEIALDFAEDKLFEKISKEPRQPEEPGYDD
jgi:hypothetical protein